jgi:5-methylcytosine-specific restriction endonuclease McrA
MGLSYYQKNKEKILERQKKYNQENKEKISKYKKEYMLDEKKYQQQYNNMTQWREKNNEHHKKSRAKYMKNYRKNNPLYILKENISHYIRMALNGKKNGSYKKYLGCTIEEYKQYLESLFTSEMTWENYGKDKYWEIDHIHPTSKGGDFHYTNTRPLSINENRSKNNKII